MQSLDLARSRASFYGFINMPFLDLPDEHFVRSLRDEAFCPVLAELGQSTDAHREITEGAALMRTYLENTGDFDHRELARQLGLDRTRLYRGVSPSPGVRPPYEALWTGKVGAADLLHELARIYREGGFTLKADVHDRDVHDRLDYIGVQLNFMELLVNKEITARQAGDRGAIQAALGDEKNFLLNHVGKWVPSFVSSALGQAQTDFYRGHLHMVKGFIEQEIALLEALQDQAVRTSR